MPIIGRIDMSDMEKVEQSYRITEKFREGKEDINYSIDNIMLVRTTDIYPENRIINPPSESVHLKFYGNFIIEQIKSEYEEYHATKEKIEEYINFKKQYSDEEYIRQFGDDSEYIQKLINRKNVLEKKFGTILNLSDEELKKILENLDTYYTYYRDTLHFTENGLVPSHPQGDFRYRPYIILEPLNEQINKANFRCFSGYDTFIKGNMTLSNKAYMIVNEENYEEIKSMHPDFEDNYNIVIYKGMTPEYIEQHIASTKNPDVDLNYERAVVEQVLIYLGYVPEIVTPLKLNDTTTNKKVESLNENLAKEKNVISNCPHNNTPDFSEDNTINIKLWYMFQDMLLDFIEKLNDIEINKNGRNRKEIASSLLNKLDVDTLIKNISLFNETIENMKKEGKLPTAKEISNGASIDIYQSYLDSAKYSK